MRRDVSPSVVLAVVSMALAIVLVIVAMAFSHQRAVPLVPVQCQLSQTECSPGP